LLVMLEYINNARSHVHLKKKKDCHYQDNRILQSLKFSRWPNAVKFVQMISSVTAW